jgi:voltage-gated potassium channel
MAHLKERVFGILDPGGEDSKIFDPFISVLIFLNVVAVILETVQTLYAKYHLIFNAFDTFSVAVFTVEYLLRLWSCTADQRFKSPVSGRLRYIVTPFAIVDLMAVLPFYLPYIFPDLRFIRSVRLFRLFRLLKLARYSDSMKTFTRVLLKKKEELAVTFFIIMILLLISSCLMYDIEHDAQPKAFADIPSAMWWGVITLATVGYGDVYPITPLGKLVGSIVVFLGLLLLAVPTGIFASGFVEELERKKQRLVCPHCGRYIDEEPDEKSKAQAESGSDS